MSLLFTHPSFSQDFDKILSKLIQIDKEANKNLKFLDLTVKGNYQVQLDKYDYAINKDFIVSTLFNFSLPLGNILAQDKCRLAQAIKLKLIFYKKNDFIILDRINLRNKKLEKVKAHPSVLSRYLLKKECSLDNFKKFTKLDFENQLSKNFFQTTKYNSICSQNFNSFIESENALQSLEAIKRAKNIKTIQKENPKTILRDFYQNIFFNKPICVKQKSLKNLKFTSSFLKKITKNFIHPVCKEQYKSIKKRNKCIMNFIDLRKTCRNAFSKDSLLFPHQTCQELLKSLSKTDQNDLEVSNFYGESLRQAYSLFKNLYFQKNKKQPKFQDMLDFLEKDDALQMYHSQICYKHRYSKLEVCEKVFFENSSHYLSINSKIEKSLKKQKYISNSMNCEFSKKAPSLLNLNKYGCKIFPKNPLVCFINYCPIKVLVNQKSTKTSFYITPNTNFSLINFNNDNKFNDFTSLLKRAFKLTEVKINNTSFIKKYLKNKNSIIQGVACLEDILHRRFPRTSFSQCSPTPLLVQAIEGNEVYIQLAIEQGFFKRKIKWKKLKNSIENFSKLTPRKWSLYAFKI